MRGWIGKFRHFVDYDLWNCDLHNAHVWRRRKIVFIRVAVLLVRNLQSSRSHLWASALTYYSLFSLVPIVALGLGVAKGFGLDNQLKEYVRIQLSNNPDVAKYLLDFSDRMLEHTSYGLVAGVGVLLLIFSVLKMIGNIEKAFNYIYGVRGERPLMLKLSYYLSVLLVCPVMLIAAGSATALLANMVTALAAQYNFFPIRFGIKLLPFPIIWLTLALIYKFLPYTKVKFGAALAGAVVSGTLYQFLQIGFVSLQVALSKYNAVYGSFSALPLFMIYLQFSWMIVLFGVQISFVCQNVDNIDAEPGGTLLSTRYRRMLCLAFAALAARCYVTHEAPPDADAFGREFHLPSRIVNYVLHVLTGSGVLVATAGDERHSSGFLPALPPDEFTAARVVALCETFSHGVPPKLGGKLVSDIEKLAEEFERERENSVLSVKLCDLGRDSA
ncbi:MAG: YihY/virulence factor BrkB family protein [Victivallaceae bacterium]|nr:YihY/virulence factor BrkB family protein [Victivallaceae bacterium]